MRHASPGRAVRTAVVALGMAALLASCAANASNPTTSIAGSPSSPHGSTSPTSRSKPSTRPATSTTLAPAPLPATGSTVVSLDLVDTTRPTVSQGQTVATTRTFPIAVYLPASAAGAPLGASLPWLVFLHGFDVTPATYDGLLRTWAGAGIAVIAPTLPLTSSRSGAYLDEADMVNEPADVSFVIDELVKRSAAKSGPLAGRLDPSRIGVAGHSDGANVAYSAAYSQALGDPRISAVIDLSGEYPIGMGPFIRTTSQPPLLMIVGDQDEYVTAAQSQELFDALTVPTWWVELLGAPHLPPFAESNAWSSVVDQVTVAFLHHVFGRAGVSAADVDAAAVAPGISELRGRP